MFIFLSKGGGSDDWSNELRWGKKEGKAWSNVLVGVGGWLSLMCNSYHQIDATSSHSLVDRVQFQNHIYATGYSTKSEMFSSFLILDEDQEVRSLFSTRPVQNVDETRFLKKS